MSRTKLLLNIPCAFAFTLSAVLAPSLLAQTCTRTDLPRVQESAGLVPGGVNNYDTIVGFYLVSSSPSHMTKAFRYSNGVLKVFQKPGANNTDFLGNNDAGRIVGDADGHGIVFYQGQYAVLDYPNSTSTSIEGINNYGTMVGTFVGASGSPHGFKKTGAGWAQLDYPGSARTKIHGISDAGVIVGEYATASNVRHGFTFYNGTYVAVNYPGATETVVNGINKYGTLVGFYISAADPGHHVAFTYKGGHFYSYTYRDSGVPTILDDINNLGDRTGSASVDAGIGEQAFWIKCR